MVALSGEVEGMEPAEVVSTIVHQPEGTGNLFGHMNTVVHGLAARLANDGAGVLSIKVLGGREEEMYHYGVVRLLSQGFIHEKPKGAV